MSPVVDVWAMPIECTVPGCGRASKAHGLCQTHYMRTRRTGSPAKARPVRRRREEGVVQVVTSVDEATAAKLEAAALAADTSVYLLAQEILERWASRQK